MRVALLVAVLSLICGMATGLMLSERPNLVAMTLVVLWVGGSLALVGARGGWTGVVATGVALSFGGGGALLAARAWRDAWRPPLRVMFDEVVGADATEGVHANVTGVLRTDAAVGDGVVVLQLDVTAIQIVARGTGRDPEWAADRAVRRVRGGVRATVGGALAAGAARDWRAGRSVSMPIWLRRPNTYRNPGALDEERALARRGTALIGTVKSGALVEISAPGTWWTEATANARASVRQIVGTHVGRWSETSAAIVTAILIGDRAGLRPDVQARLQDAGTYHVLAISGGNIAILAMIALAIFRWTGTLGRAAMVIAIGTFVIYGSVVTGGASVDRAITVAVFAFAARIIDQRVDARHGLAVAAGFLAAIDPLALLDPGFLLSFGATSGIVVGLPLLRGRLQSTVAEMGAALFVTSLAAELALLPIVAFLFGRITVAGLALNFVAIPLMAVAQIAGLALIPVATVWGAAGDVLGWVAAVAAGGIVESASAVEWMPAVAWRVSRPSLPAMAVYYVTLLVALAAWRVPAGLSPRMVPSMLMRCSASMAAAGAVLWIAAEPWTLWTARGDGRLHVTFLDVGQGDATLVRFPWGATMLVDAGGSPSEAFDVGDRVVAPTLRHLGIRRLDTLVLSHGDGDHVAGAVSIANAFRPFDVWEGVPVPRSPLLQSVRLAADAVGARWTSMQRADETSIDGVRVVVHHPTRPDWERQDPRNDDSIVLELRWRDVSIILPGDISRAVEAEIGPRFETAPLRVLKAAHHGSASSSSERWLSQLRPTAAVVSAGRYNTFGHPAPSVLARYALVGTAMYRTDRDGAISIDTDGARLVVHTVSGRSAVHEPRR